MIIVAKLIFTMSTGKTKDTRSRVRRFMEEKKTGGEDKKTNRAIARKIGQCCYVVEEVKARRNLIKGITEITERGLFPHNLGRNV